MKHFDIQNIFLYRN